MQRKLEADAPTLVLQQNLRAVERQLQALSGQLAEAEECRCGDTALDEFQALDEDCQQMRESMKNVEEAIQGQQAEHQQELGRLQAGTSQVVLEQQLRVVEPSSLHKT